MLNIFAMYLHYVLLAFVLISVGAAYFKVRRARKAGQKDVVIMFGNLNAVQEAPRWFTLLMNFIALIIVIVCSAFLVFAAYIAFFKM